MHTNTRLCLALLVAGCSSSDSAPDTQLPSATFTPQIAASAAPVACGEDISFYGNPEPDLRYAFLYDTDGRITSANGQWVADGSTENSVYTWSGDNLTHILSTSSYDGSTWELAAGYDVDNNLLDYTYSVNTPSYQDTWSYVLSNYVGGVPTRQVITQQGQPVVTYDLVYDATNRLVQAVPDAGPSTTWTYDDVARTVSQDTDNGLWTGLVTYDEQFRMLSAAWGGSDPAVIHGEETWSWNGDQLDSVAYRSGSEAAPTQLELVQTETLRYDCSMARQHAGTSTKRPARGLVRF